MSRARDLRGAISLGRGSKAVLHAAGIAAFGLVPSPFAEPIGSRLQQLSADMVIGGLATAANLALFLLPTPCARFAAPRVKRRAPEGCGAAAAPTPVE